MSLEEKMVRLRGSDGEAFEVPEEAIGAASVTVRGMIEEGLAGGVVELPKFTAATLSRVVEYVKKHYSESGEDGDDSFAPVDDGPLARFDDEFVNVDNDTLIDLIEAADFLNIQKLMDLTCKAVADQFKGRTTDEIRKKFGIVNDYTKDEEEEIRRENSWAFE